MISHREFIFAPLNPAEDINFVNNLQANVDKVLKKSTHYSQSSQN